MPKSKPPVTIVPKNDDVTRQADVSATQPSVDASRAVVCIPHWDPYDAAYRVRYLGRPADLIAAGVAAPDMVHPGTKGKRRKTPAGFRFWRQKPNIDGVMSLTIQGVPPEIAETMPGVPRTWRSTVYPSLRLTDDLAHEFAREDKV